MSNYNQPQGARSDHLPDPTQKAADREESTDGRLLSKELIELWHHHVNQLHGAIFRSDTMVRELLVDCHEIYHHIQAQSEQVDLLERGLNESVRREDQLRERAQAAERRVAELEGKQE